MIATILGWTKLPQWALELIVIVLIACAIWFWQHERYKAGINEQQRIDAASTADLIKKTSVQTAALQAKATSAELAYVQEHQANIEYQREHPNIPVRLCIAAPASGSRVPAGGTAHPGNASAGTGTATVPAVHGGDTSDGTRQAGVDIGPLLNSFALRCDEVGATLREFQKR